MTRVTVGPDAARLRVAALAWGAAVQFFLTQAVVALAWATPFSLSQRYISDLGNTVCAPYPVGGTVVICSPWHAAMNLSFILLGLTMLLGCVTASSAFRGGALRGIGLTLLAVAGVGVILVGLYPENENPLRHMIGAGLNFIPGNIALVALGLAGVAGGEAKWFRTVSVVMGLVGLGATALFVADLDLGLGTGGIERVAAYPQSLWQILAGTMLWASRRP